MVFVASPNEERDWIKVDEEIFDHVGKRMSEGDTAPIAGNIDESEFCKMN